MNLRKLNEELDTLLYQPINEISNNKIKEMPKRLNIDKIYKAISKIKEAQELLDYEFIKSDLFKIIKQLEDIIKTTEQQYQEWLNYIDEILIKELGYDIKDYGYSWQIREGEIYKGNPKDRGGKPIHNEMGSFKWTFEILKDGKPYTQVKTVEDMINFFKEKI